MGRGSSPRAGNEATCVLARPISMANAQGLLLCASDVDRRLTRLHWKRRVFPRGFLRRNLRFSVRRQLVRNESRAMIEIEPEACHGAGKSSVILEFARLDQEGVRAELVSFVDVINFL